MKKWTNGAIPVHLFGMWKQVIVNPPVKMVASMAMIRGRGRVLIQPSSSIRVAPILPCWWT